MITYELGNGLRDGKGGMTRVFADWTEWCEFVQRPSQMAEADRCSRSTKAGGTHRGMSWEQAVNVMEGREHWAAAQEMLTLSRRIDGEVEALVASGWTSKWGDRGRPIVARVVQDHPRSFRRRVRQQKVAKAVNIMVNVSATSGVKANTLLKRGALIVAFVNAMRRAGRTCNVYVCDACGDPGVLTYIVPVALPGQPTTESRIAFALGNPEFLRRIAFSAHETEGATAREVTVDGLGASRNPHPEDIAKYGQVFFQHASGAEANWEDEEAAARIILEHLKAFGVKAGVE